MANQKRKMTLLTGVCGVMFFALFMVNQWVTQQIHRIVDTQTLPQPLLKEGASEHPALPQARPVRIDPLNDPLAPVLKKEPPQPASISSFPDKPKKFYEPSLEDTVLVQ